MENVSFETVEIDALTDEELDEIVGGTAPVIAAGCI